MFHTNNTEAAQNTQTLGGKHMKFSESFLYIKCLRNDNIFIRIYFPITPRKTGVYKGNV